MKEHPADKMARVVGVKGTVLVFHENKKWHVQGAPTPAVFVKRDKHWQIDDDHSRTV